MERQRPTLFTVLDEWAEMVHEAMREAEAVAWHHSPAGTPEADHYERLVRMSESIDYQKANSPQRLPLVGE